MGTFFLIGGFLASSLILGLVVGVVARMAGVEMVAEGSRIFTEPLLDVGFQLLVLALAIPVVLGTVWLIQRRRPGTVSSVAGRLRWRWLVACVPLGLLAVVVGEGAQQLTLFLSGAPVTYEWGGWAPFLQAMAVILLLVPFQAAAEEYVFRGWVIQAFGAYMRNPWPAFIIGSAGFAALHGYTDWGIAYVFGFGILSGWLAVRTGGLEAPIALHVVNNVIAFGFSAADGNLDGALEQGSLPWQTVVGTVTQFAVFTGLILVFVRKAAVQTVSR
ncbi:hypothetical protein Acor_51500 [Acrocarpospora corrugata]|uniref:CAAX prenyl protease 2/Lysostaphin resistance protein A-like domain-containing protein n=1 Tax=Acrocarpospora corrugata TaxID=35763 RepID=A0A5M3W2V2_9ACTN|nr:type II CAAX endopeptidase family protein [Acrocarpospora corrugata]GES03084.1 hypothetical protein Acor_51500 [Acrocarpospora corrugata]